MNLIERIRNKPHSYKIRLMWIIIGCVVVVLIAIWILVNRIGNNVNIASFFFKEQVKEIKNTGKQLFEENK
jgi:cytoskeletal protein RodZ